MTSAAAAVDRPGAPGDAAEHRGARGAKRAGPGRLHGRRLIKVAAVALALTGAGLLAHRAFTRPVPVQVAIIGSAEVRDETRGPGTIQSRFPVSVGSRVAGTIESVLVDVGDEVSEGQVLSTLDRTELEARAGAARRAVDAARQDVVLAEALLDKATSDRYLAQTSDARNGTLAREGLASLELVDQSSAALRASEANERAASAAIAARKAALARAVEEQRVAETIAAYATITSPMAGLVTRRALEPGSTVAPGSTIVQLVDPTSLWVVTLVDQSLAGRVRVGQSASIRLRSGVDLTGHVARVSLEADPVTRELEVNVALDERPERFAIHEEADVIIFGEKHRGLAVPLEAVVRSPPAAAAVFTVEGGRAARKVVRLGPSDRRHAIVLDGVRAGDVVVMEPRALRDQRAVVAAEPSR